MTHPRAEETNETSVDLLSLYASAHRAGTPRSPEEIMAALAEVQRLAGPPDPSQSGTPAGWPTNAAIRTAFRKLRTLDALDSLQRSRVPIGAPGDSAELLGRYFRTLRWLHLVPSGRLEEADLVWLHNEAGVASLAQGRPTEATALFKAAYELTSDSGRWPGSRMRERIALNLGQASLDQGEHSLATRWLTPLTWAEVRDDAVRALAPAYLGVIAQRAGRCDEAGRHFALALERLSRRQDARPVCFTLLQAIPPGDTDPAALREALSAADRAIEAATASGDEDLRVLALVRRAGISAVDMEAAPAARLSDLSYAIRYAAFMDAPRIQCEALIARATVLLRIGEANGATASAAEALHIAAGCGMKISQIHALLTLARIALHRKAADAARHMVGHAGSLAQACGYVGGNEAANALTAAPV